VAAARRAAPELELVAGGKSMGGRMTSMAEAGEPLEGVRGLVFLGFPLHPARRPASTRGEHLARIARPMLFLQGTRDPLADLALVRPLCASLGPRAALVICDDADHGFAVRRSAGRSDAAVRQELVDAVAAWLDRL
jgi:predicted alpha/beta-hydrolase family hydrolase